MSPADLLEEVRRRLPELMDPSAAVLRPFTAADATRWGSADPVGAVMLFDIPVIGPNEQAAVLASARDSESWTFTTIAAPIAWNHPVSGNRRFGFRTAPDGAVTIFTRGADRATRLVDGLLEDTIFGGAELLWTRWQQRLVDLVRSLGGDALVPDAGRVSARRDWATIRGALFTPTESWLATPAPFAGAIRTNDERHRFRLQTSEGRVAWTERNEADDQLAVVVAAVADGAGFRVSRENDEQVLRHLGYRDALITPIRNAGPRPSYLMVRDEGDRLVADWYGLKVRLRPDGTLLDLQQPGSFPPTRYVFERVP